MRDDPSPLYDRDSHFAPFTDTDSAQILHDTVEALAPRRTMYWLGDSGVTLHVLASLHAQIQERLPDADADARDQDYSWAQIGDLLNLTRAGAWNRYGRPGRRGTPTPLPED